MTTSDPAVGVTRRPYRVLYDPVAGTEDADEDDATASRLSPASSSAKEDDNYTDPTLFLSRLRLNANVRHRRWGASALTSMTISQQCCVVVLHACAHGTMRGGGVDVDAWARRATGALCVGLCAWACVDDVEDVEDEDEHEHSRHRRRGTPLTRFLWRALRSVRLGALTTCGLAALSPLCRTMTAAMSSDTAHVCACLGLVMYAITYDYAFMNLETKQLASTFSLGASMFASMLLASRFDDARASYVDALLAVESYVLSPYVWRAVRSFSPALHVCVVTTMHVIAFFAVRAHHAELAVAYAVGAALLALGAPTFLVQSVSRGKTQIAGPWDEALPSLDLFRNTERAAGVPRYRHYVANKRVPKTL